MSTVMRVLLLLFLAACGGAQSEASSETVDPPPKKIPSTPAVAAAPARIEPAAELPVTRAPTPQERFSIERLVQKAEQIRNLKFKYPVPIEVQNRAAIEEFVRNKLKEEDLATDKLVYTTLGLLEPETDIEALLTSVMGEQIVGYYDPEDDRFVVRDDVMAKLKDGAAGMESASVIVHEMVHALQGQHLGLRDHYGKDQDSDLALAYQSLVEGDATLAMIGLLAGQSGVPMSALLGQLDAMVAMAKSAQGGQASLEAAPPIVRVTLVAPYFEGLRFVGTRYKSGEWGAVNSAFKKLPKSMEQVLHVEKYGIDQPMRIRLKPIKAILKQGYKLAKEDTLGELEMSIYLAAPGEERNERAAAGWGGDRLHVYSPPEDADATVGGIAVWHTRWDSKTDATEAAHAANKGGVLVSKHGTDVLFVHSSDRALAERVRREVVRTSRTRFPPFPSEDAATTP